jgi:uncharacterized protein
LDNGSTKFVELIFQTRIAEDGCTRYIAWQKKIEQMLASQPGFAEQCVFPPKPPAQVDWIVIWRFHTLEHARGWLATGQLASTLQEVKELFLGKDDIFLRTDVKDTAHHVSALITCQVDPSNEGAFLEWEREVFRAESAAPGFIGHRLDRPVPGIEEHWVIVLSFDSDANLTKWLESPKRAELLEAGSRFQSDVTVRKGVFGFGFWGREEEPAPPLVVFKNNLVVLLVLYPIVYLWGYLVGDPLLGALGVPFWLALFIGNLFSTQVLGWWAVPWAFERFDTWLSPECSSRRNAIGFAVMLALFGLSMALYAWLLNLPKLSYF